MFAVASDEAGFGCCAGSLWVAAIGGPADWQLPGVKDSKTLSDSLIRIRARDILALSSPPGLERRDRVLVEALVAFSPEEIDAQGVHRCLKEGHRLVHEIAARKMRRRYGSAVQVTHIADGNLPLTEHGIRSVVKADVTVPLCSAASIIAKAAQLQAMAWLAEEHPEYEFSKHNGYVTKLHTQALNRHGPIKGVHRFSYSNVAAAAAQKGMT